VSGSSGSGRGSGRSCEYTHIAEAKT
jgi:hypothetical protein